MNHETCPAKWAAFKKYWDAAYSYGANGATLETNAFKKWLAAAKRKYATSASLPAVSAAIRDGYAKGFAYHTAGGLDDDAASIIVAEEPPATEEPKKGGKE